MQQFLQNVLGFFQANTWIPLVVIAITIIIIVALSPIVLAKKKWGFTTLPQGQIMVVMNGDSRSHYLARLGKWVVDKNGFVLRGEKPEEALLFRLFHWLTGVYWYGLPPFRRLHEYKFTWGKWVDGSDSVKRYDDVMVPSVYFRFPYGHRFTGLETSAKHVPDGQNNPLGGRSGLTFPVRIDMLIEVQVVDLDLCLFPEAAWLKKLLGLIQEILKGEVGGLTYEDLIEQKDADKPTNAPGKKSSRTIAQSIMSHLCGEGMVEAVEKDIPEALTNEAILKLPSVQEIGVIVRKIDVLNVEVDLPEKEAAAILETINRVAVETRKARAKVVEAQGIAESTKLVGEAEAGIIAKKGAAEAESIAARHGAYDGNKELIRADAHRDGLVGTKVRTLVLGATSTPLLLNDDGGEEAAGEKPAAEQPKPRPRRNQQGYDWGKGKS